MGTRLKKGLDIEAELFVFFGQFEEIVQAFPEFLRSAAGRINVGDADALVGRAVFPEVSKGASVRFERLENVAWKNKFLGIDIAQIGEDVLRDLPSGDQLFQPLLVGL